MPIDEKPPFPPGPSAAPEPEPEAPRREGGWVPRPEWFAAPESSPERAEPSPLVEGPPPATPDRREPQRTGRWDAAALLGDPAAPAAPAAVPGVAAATGPALGVFAATGGAAGVPAATGPAIGGSGDDPAPVAVPAVAAPAPTTPAPTTPAPTTPAPPSPGAPGAAPALRPPPQRRGVTTALRLTEPHPLPETRPLFVVLVSLLAIPAILASWFWLKAARFQLLQALSLSLDAANDDPLVLYMMLELILLLATLAAWVWRDAGQRGFGTAGRIAWAAAVGGLGTIAVWAYLAVRPDREKSG